ncbi:Bromodomain-containing protein, partial [Phakopsora pachyrhizi]
FLSRVKKSNPPDYYDIIKHPMDLGTVLKKVKSGACKTKAAFTEDLKLIWANCLVYNSPIVFQKK